MPSFTMKQQVAVFGLLALAWTDHSLAQDNGTGFFFYREAPKTHVIQRLSASDAYVAYLEINGAQIRCVVDTGASFVTLGIEGARIVGLKAEDLYFTSRAATAAGFALVAPVVLDEITMGPFVDADIPAVVTQNNTVGCLLGLPYLDRFEIRIDGEQMILTRRG